MKRLLLTLIAIITMANMYATGFETIGGLRYIIDTDAKTATLTADTVKYSGDIVVPEKVTLAGIDYPVVAFAKECFSGCSSLTSVVIPQSVTSLGNSCFYGCKSLIHVGMSLSITNIGDFCFEDCESLQYITIPRLVTSLGRNCFFSCYSLTNIEIQGQITSIGEACFAFCRSLASITLPESLTSIGSNCFQDCSLLKTIGIPNLVSTIGNNSFSHCYALKSITLPSSLIRIGQYAFLDDTQLDTICCYATEPPKVVNYVTKDYYTSAEKGLGQKGTSLLYVPTASIEKYKQTLYWQDFMEILPIKERSEGIYGKCDKPTISFANGKLHFESGTAGANYHYTLTCNDVATDAYSEDGDVNLNASYNITAYAIAEGYSTSDNATATLYWVDGRIEGDATGITATTAKRGIVVSTQNGNVTLSGLNDGEKVSFYSINGSNLGAVTAKGNIATSNFATGQIVIAKVGNTSIKIAL